MEEKKIQELIDQIREENEMERTYLKKQLNMMKIMMVAMLGIFILLLVTVSVLLPKVTQTLDGANQAIVQISDTMTEVEGMFDSVDELMNDSKEGITIAIESMNSIDFEGLNRSIEDLGNIVSPLADFFGRFN